MTEYSKSVANFDIRYTQFLDKDGNPTQALPENAKQVDTLLRVYRTMVLNRVFDKKAIALQRTGKMGTYPSTLGQEAISIAAASVMRDDDILCPYYREYGGQLWRGVKMEEILLYWGGDECGSDFQGPREDLPFCVPIASQVLHAVGVATAFKLRKQPRVSVSFVGDGGSSKGDFYEAINVAGVWNLPTVFIVNNNQWAISVPSAKQTHAETFAQKAIAGGIHGEQVDGNDFIAMQYVLGKAVERARSGKGPSVIEAITYRMCDHTTADDARRYREQSEVDSHKKEDPIIRLRSFLANEGAWDESKEKALHQEVAGQVESAVETYFNTPKRAPETMFDHLFASLPDAYQTQVEELKTMGGAHG